MDLAEDIKDTVQLFFALADRALLLRRYDGIAIQLAVAIPILSPDLLSNYMSTL